MRRIGSIVGILLVLGLLLGLVPPALAAADIDRAVLSMPQLDNGQGKDIGKVWHLGTEITVVKGRVESVTLEGDGIVLQVEGVELPVEVSEDAIKGPIKSRIWGGIEDPEALVGSVIVALVYKDGDVYIAKHIAIVPGMTFAHYCGNVTGFEPYSDGEDGSITIQPAKPLVDDGELTFTVVEGTKFLNGEPEIGDRVTVIAQKPYEEGIAALTVVTCRKPALLTEVIRLKGTITDISDNTITLDVDGESKSVALDEETVVVIKGAISLNVGDEVIIIAVEGDDGQLLAKGIFAGLEPAHMMQWLERHRVRWFERMGIPWLERLRNQWFGRQGTQ